MKIKLFIPIIFTFILMVIVMWWVTNDLMESLILAFFFLGGFTFNYNIIFTYKSIKSNGFKLKQASEEIHWPYIFISTTLVVICFYFFMPSLLQITGLIVTLCVLVGLFFLDLILNGFK